MSITNRYVCRGLQLRSLPGCFWSAGLFLAVLMLPGCGAGQSPSIGTNPPVQTSNRDTGVVAPASAPGVGEGYSNYGAPLTKVDFLHLTLGNTLFRPLADGGKTRIYVSPTGDLTVRITDPAGQTTTEIGNQTVNSQDACWLLKGQSTPLCFSPYWNGGLMTLQFNDSKILPAQFLIERGERLS